MYLGQQSNSSSPAPDWTTQEIWDRAQQEAQSLLSNPSGGGQYNQGVWRTLAVARNSGDITPLVNALAAQYTAGGQFGNPELSRVLAASLVPGAGLVGSLAGSATAGATGLSEVTLPSSVAPSGAVPGALGPSVPATAASTAVGPAVAGGAAGGALSGLNWTTLVPSLVSGVTGLLGADAQADAAGDAAQLSREMFDIARADALPRIETGNRAVGVLDQVQGLTTGTPDMSRFFTSPDYQFNLAEGTKAGQRALSSMGLSQSGPAVKEATRFASGLASREYGSFVDRLLATAGLGTTGAAQSAAAGATNASIGGNAVQNRGAARSSGYGAVNDAVQGGIGNYLLQQYLNRNPVYG